MLKFFNNDNNRFFAMAIAIILLMVQVVILTGQNEQMRRDIAKIRQVQIDTIRIISETYLKKDLEAKKEIQEKMDEMKAKRQVVEELKENPDKINSKLNLSYKPISVEEMNRIIAYWDKYVDGGTPFKNKGEAFVKASKESGLDPIYIMAHAAWESGWGKSRLAKDKGNYFGIAAYDNNPYECAYTMGDSLDTGIIQGAKWIKANYYDRGYTNLNDMIALGNYASDNIYWINGILSIMRESYAII